jgi:hypothetical protein
MEIQTSSADAGSVAAETQSAGNPPPPQPTPENGSAGDSAANSWYNGLSEGNRKLADSKGWTSPEGLEKALTSYAELERKQGDSLRIPDPDAPPEELDKFYSKLGRPETPDKYEFKRPEGLPPDLPYSDDLANKSKAWMHEAGLNTRQAQALHDRFIASAAEDMAAQQAAIAKAVETTHDELVGEWGPADSDSFKERHELANRAMKNLGLVESYQKAGILLPDGALTDPTIARAFAEIGEKMFREDTIEAGNGVAAGENPFKRNKDGKITNPGAISALIKNDLPRAKRLMREAGEPASNWISENPL